MPQKRTRRNTFMPDSPPSPYRVDTPYLYEMYAIPEQDHIQSPPKMSPYEIGREYSDTIIKTAVAKHIEKTNREKNIDTKTI